MDQNWSYDWRKLWTDSGRLWHIYKERHDEMKCGLLSRSNKVNMKVADALVPIGHQGIRNYHVVYIYLYTSLVTWWQNALMPHVILKLHEWFAYLYLHDQHQGICSHHICWPHAINCHQSISSCVCYNHLYLTSVISVCLISTRASATTICIISLAIRHQPPPFISSWIFMSMLM